jgi:hypothetical protein
MYRATVDCASVKPSLEQFAMNVWRTPEVICTAHLANGRAQFGCDPRPTNAIA